MKIKQVTKKMLVNAAKEFEQWYGVTIPYRLMVRFSRKMSYDDWDGFDTCARENVAYYIGDLVVGEMWPCGANSQSESERFFKKFKKNCSKFGVKVNWD